MLLRKCYLCSSVCMCVSECVFVLLSKCHLCEAVCICVSECGFVRACMTISTETATSPKSTKSTNSDFSVSRGTNLN